MSQRLLILLDDATRAIAFAREEAKIIMGQQPAPGPTPTPTPTPTPAPGGNPRAIQPPLPWAPGSPQSEAKHLIFHSGQVFAFEVPGPHVLSPGAISVNFTEGQDPNFKAHTTEYCISRTPGLIDLNAGEGWYITSGGSYKNTALYWRDDGLGKQPLLNPALAPWYINVRWTQPEGQPSGSSLQWVQGA